MENKKKSKKKKPLRRAERWGSQVLPIAGRLLASMVAVAVMGLLFSALQALGPGLRLAITVVLVGGMLVLLFSEGLNKGAADAAASRNYVTLSAKGIKMEEKEDAACYHPLKALCACAVVFALPLLAAVFVAVTAKEYTYALQDLPTWLTDSYGSRMDVMAPLGAYTAEQSLLITDWVRMFVRLFEMLFVNFFNDPLKMGLAIDRLSPLFILSYPVAYMAGYLVGPASNRKQEKLNRRAKKVAVRRAQKKSLVDELTGAQGQVHYGHKKEEHKKKELI
ncbi:MAG: hypothetical protein IJB85_03365 [Clostridia bacterium]|nr:hypothetical protein [Clostridia bacterium]